MDNYINYLWSQYSDEDLLRIIKHGKTLDTYIEEAKEVLRVRRESQDETLKL
jgi:hypothetical protein